MKIAIICYYHVDATISLVKYLKQVDSNLEIDFICLFDQSDKNATPISFPNVEVKNGFLDEADIEKVIDKPVRDYLKGFARFRIFLFNSWFIYDIKNYILLFQLRNKLIKENYTVINFVGNNRIIIFLNIITKMKAKFHMIHEPYPHKTIQKRRFIMHKMLMNLVINTGSHILVPSVVSYNRFINNWKIDQNKISIVCFSQFEIYKAYIDKEIPKADNILLFYGLINQYKGVEALIAAMNKVIKVLPDLKLIIAGKGEIKYDLTTLSDNFEIVNRYITNEEIAELNQMATLVVCPYSSASQSGVVMTSFAFNNPILATNVGALPEVIEDGKTGILVEYPDPDLLAEKIIEFFENPDKIIAFRNNIIDKYSKSEHSWGKIAAQYYTLLKSEISKTT
jgi:glycosyltransferase involved in cell wall biosynthesis